MLHICTFFWKPVREYRSQFTPEHVNILARMVHRNYTGQHEFVCFTDTPGDIDSSIVVVKKLWDEFGSIPSPWGRHGPSCYRRLKLFDPRIEEMLGKRFVSLDLDCIITGDMTTVWDREETFVIWGDTSPFNYYNGSMILMTAGARSRIYSDFDPRHSPREVAMAGVKGSDQGWISYKLGRGEKIWTTRDGVYSWRLHLREPRMAGKGKPLPENAKIVFFHGHEDPWSPGVRHLEWVQKHYR